MDICTVLGKGQSRADDLPGHPTALVLALTLHSTLILLGKHQIGKEVNYTSARVFDQTHTYDDTGLK